MKKDAAFTKKNFFNPANAILPAFANIKKIYNLTEKEMGRVFEIQRTIRSRSALNYKSPMQVFYEQISKLAAR